MKITLDANILVRAVVAPRGPAARLLDIVLAEHELVLSRFILEAVQRVLRYPESDCAIAPDRERSKRLRPA